MSTLELSNQEIQRREKLNRLRDLGINPYPADLYPVTDYSTDIKKKFEDGKEVCIAGRMMSNRDMGKAAFAEIQDAEGRIQIYVNRDEICPGEDKTLYNQVFKKLLDLGDFIGVKGIVFKTKVGETSIKVKELTLLSKSLNLCLFQKQMLKEMCTMLLPTQN